MNGTSDQELAAVKQQLVEKLNQRFGDLPPILREALLNSNEDPALPGRFRELLSLAGNTGSLNEFLYKAMLGPGASPGTPQVTPQ